MNRTRLFASLGVLLAACTAGALLVAGRAHATAEAPALVLAQVAVPAVRLAKVGAVRAAPHEEITGSLMPARSLQLGFEVGGRLARIEVRKGAPVGAGQIIARLDPEIADAQVAQAEAAVKAAEAQSQMASDVARRNAELSQAGSVSDLQNKSSGSSAAAALAQLAAARAQLQQARAARHRHDLRAPFAGVLVDAPDQIGATVAPAAALFTLEQLDPLTLKITVAETARAALRAGLRVHVDAVSGAASTDDATIRSVIPSADGATRRVPVEISVPNKQGRFTAHTLGRALLALGAEEDALEVPASALASNGGDHVFVLGNAGEVRRVPVQVLDRGSKLVVLRSAQPLSQVIDYPAADLAEGVKVSIR